MRLNLTVLYLSVCFFISGCAVIYFEPKNGETAELKIINASGHTFLSEGGLCGRQKAIGTRNKFIKVKSGKRIYIHNFYHNDKGGYEIHCSTSLSFLPQIGKRYISEFNFDIGKGCEAFLYKVDALNNNIYEPSFENENQSKC